MKTISEISKENLNTAKKIAGGTFELLSEKTNTNPAYLSQINNGAIDPKTKKPRTMGSVTARKIEAGLKLQEGWMDTDHSEPVKKEKQIYESNVIERGRKIVPVPRISWVKAGAFECSNYTDETSEPDYYVETTVRVSSRAFALTVDNDSMIDLDGGPYSFPEGSDIICDPDKECTVGSFVIAKDTRTQKTTFKKLTSDGLHLYLSPLNKRYNTIPIDNEHIRLIAKVIDTSIKLP